jgi:hypothetical protein
VSYEDLPKVEKRAIRLAAAALTCAMAQDWERASKAVQRISDECGSVGVGRAILGWSDTLISRMGHTPGRPVAIAFQEVESGRIDSADGDFVPERVKWAGRVLAARAADDQATWDALMDALPDDGTAIGEHVAAVLEMCALMLRRMGAAS